MTDAAPNAKEEALAEMCEKLAAAIERGESPDLGSLAIEFGVSLSDVRAAADGLLALHDAKGVGSPIAADPALRSSPKMPTLPGDLELLSEIGRGGMGIVYRARQKSLGRDIAVKVLRPGELQFSAALRRFKKEAEHLAKLRHPNIVAIHEVGESDGVLYFTMDLIDGRTLAETAREGRLTGRRIARILKLTAAALAYIHEHGLIHRDLKPANILIDHAGTPYVTDFGLALDIDGPDSLTRTGQLLGTPAYMAPEQARGDKVAIGPATDVWALGAILYECLTGRAPFSKATVLETLQAIVDEPPVLPRSIRPTVPRDLEAIALKALEKDPAKRYRGAAEFVADLERFEAGEAVEAASPNLASRALRKIVRHRTISAAIACAVVMAALVLFERGESRDQKISFLSGAADELFAHGAFAAAAERYEAAAATTQDPSRRDDFGAAARQSLHQEGRRLIAEKRFPAAVAVLERAIAADRAFAAAGNRSRFAASPGRTMTLDGVRMLDDLIEAAVGAGDARKAESAVVERRRTAGISALAAVIAPLDFEHDDFDRLKEFLIAEGSPAGDAAMRVLESDQPSWIASWGRNGLVDRLIDLGDPAAAMIERAVRATTAADRDRDLSVGFMSPQPLAAAIEQRFLNIAGDPAATRAARLFAAQTLVEKTPLAIEIPRDDLDPNAERIVAEVTSEVKKLAGTSGDRRNVAVARAALERLRSSEKRKRIARDVLRRLLFLDLDQVESSRTKDDFIAFIEDAVDRREKLGEAADIARRLGLAAVPSADDIEKVINIAARRIDDDTTRAALRLAEIVARPEVRRPIERRRRRPSVAIDAFRAACLEAGHDRPREISFSLLRRRADGDYGNVDAQVLSRRVTEDSTTFNIARRPDAFGQSDVRFAIPGWTRNASIERRREINLTVTTPKKGAVRCPMSIEVRTFDIDGGDIESYRIGGSVSSRLASPILGGAVAMTLDEPDGEMLLLVHDGRDVGGEGDASPDTWRRRVADALDALVARVSIGKEILAPSLLEEPSPPIVELIELAAKLRATEARSSIELLAEAAEKTGQSANIVAAARTARRSFDAVKPARMPVAAAEESRSGSTIVPRKFVIVALLAGMLGLATILATKGRERRRYVGGAVLFMLGLLAAMFPWDIDGRSVGFEIIGLAACAAGLHFAAPAVSRGRQAAAVFFLLAAVFEFAARFQTGSALAEGAASATTAVACGLWLFALVRAAEANGRKNAASIALLAAYTYSAVATGMTLLRVYVSRHPGARGEPIWLAIKTVTIGAGGPILFVAASITIATALNFGRTPTVAEGDQG